MKARKKILILCTANSARSQMAEALLNQICQGKYEVHSAGSYATFVRPEAIKVMAEIGIDISNNRSKSVDKFSGAKIDFVLTVCDDAQKNCPYFPANTLLVHHPFEDPALVDGSKGVKLEAFRKSRDQIFEYLETDFIRVIDAKSA